MTLQEVFSLPRNKAAQILRRVMPAKVALQATAADCGEGGCHGGDVAYDPSGRAYRYALLNAKDAYDPEFGYYQIGDPGWWTGISTGDYGPPGDTVYGRFEALYTADGNLADVRFVQMERSGSWFEEHIDTIGPLAVKLAAMAAGAGFLPSPADTTGAQMFDFFDAPSDFNLPVDVPADLPFDVVDFSVEDFTMPPDYGYFDEMYGPGGIAEPVPPSYVPGEEVPVGDYTVEPNAPTVSDAGWTSGDELSSGGYPTGDAPVPAVQPPSVAPAPITEPPPNVMQIPSINETLGTLNKGMVEALKSLQTARQLIALINNPRSIQPGGTSRVVRADGTVLTRDAQGRSQVTRPAVGVGEVAQDGSVVINNGNGSYTRITPDGRSQTLKYPSNLAQVGQQAGYAQMLPLLAVGAVALYFMSRKR